MLQQFVNIHIRHMQPTYAVRAHLISHHTNSNIKNQRI